MILYNEQLRVLYDMVCRKQHLEKLQEELLSQKNMLLEEVEKLQKSSLKEQADVERLEGGSLASFFYNVIGKMDEKLTKEREEAYAAKVKYDAAARELSKVEIDLQKNEASLEELVGCEKEYEELLVLKKERMKELGHWAMEKVFEYEQRLTYLNNQERELEEAIAAGEEVLDLTERVLNSLDSAEGWGTFDILGGGIIADAMKYSDLDDAQLLIEELQDQLRRFKTELADVTIDYEMNIQIDGFLQFADFFFDNLFTDWAVMDKIHNSQHQVENTEEQIEHVMEKLREMKEQVLVQKETIQKKRDELVVQVNI